MDHAAFGCKGVWREGISLLGVGGRLCRQYALDLDMQGGRQGGLVFVAVLAL